MDNKNEIDKTQIDKTQVDRTQIDRTQADKTQIGYSVSYDKININYFLDRYSIKKELEYRGVEADYYLIIDEKDNEYFLKLYRKGFKPKTEIIKRLQELYKEYPKYFINIIKYGYDSKLERYYEIQEYIKNGNLWDYYKDKEITIEELKEIVGKINEALKILHSKNIIHRDIKPQNILVRKTNPIELVITDFGISSLNEEDVSKIITTAFKGTIIYSAPEAFSNYFGKEIDYWALGIVLLEIITKKHPFRDLPQQVIMNQIFTKGVPINEDIDEQIRKLLRNLLKRDYNKRWGYEEVDKWLKGLHVEEYEEEIDKNEIEEWLKKGFTEKSAKEWMKVINDPKIASGFKEEGFSVIEAKEWVQAGIKSGSLASRWKKKGFSPEDAVFFEDNGIPLKRLVNLNNKLKVEIEDLKVYLKMGLDVQKIEEIVEKISLKEYIVFYNAGIKELKEILEWKGSEFSLSEIKEWKGSGLSLIESKEWKNVGFNPNEAKNFREAGISINEAKEWKEMQDLILNEAKELERSRI